MKNFGKINVLIGWALFLVATIVYTLTVEPTASFWDCAEYIATSFKLEVPHAPGAPFFLLLARMFSFLAGSDVTKVAFWTNMSSVLASAGSVMMVFRIISLLGRKLFQKNAQTLLSAEALSIWAAGITGALALTFCDTFWFTATETETYASSTLIMALVVWAMLNWELTENRQLAHRWLLLIAYLVGISIGLRIFSLLTIPALALIFYFKTSQQATFKGAIFALIVSGLIIATIYIGIIPGLPTLALKFELFFVNRLTLPFGSGAVVFGLLLISSVVYGIHYSIKKQKEILNVALLCLTFILIGYSSYALVLIRSNANPPLNENSPDDVISFISYLKREQYGDRPLLYGPYFTAHATGRKEGAPIYRKGENNYEMVGYKYSPVYNPKDMTILPRIWSNDESRQHPAYYRTLLNLKKGQKPTFKHNLYYLFTHQLGYFYFRYFLWNFAGRESDHQGARWLTPLDALKKVPEAITHNRARNNYLMLPLLLGLLGLIFQYKNDVKRFWIVSTLFFILGMALVLFLNPPPVEPRERDYIYVGSFLIFTIWIGLGVLAVIDYLKKFFQSPKTVITVSAALCLVAPTLMAFQGWNDHDRSRRYFSVDAAKNMLASCAPNAILFTGGDNDTFPLWYVQEVEGFRTDVRVIVLSYANTDWYIAQMRRQSHMSAPLPLSLTKENYRQHGLNDILPYIQDPAIRTPIDVRQYLRLIREEHPRLQLTNGLDSNIIPSKMMCLKIDKEDILAKGIISDDKKHLLVKNMVWSLKERALEKKDLVILDLIVSSNWERPIYFNHTSLHGIYLDLKDYVVQEGLAYRLLPIKDTVSFPMVNTEVMYDNMMNKSYWRALDNPKVYYDENYKNFVSNHRVAFSTLAEALLQEGKVEKASKVLLKCLEQIPDVAIPYDPANIPMIAMLFALGENEKALGIARKMGERSEEILAYRLKSGPQFDYSTQKNLAILQEIGRILQEEGQEALAQEYQAAFYKYYQALTRNINSS
ncbi:MAG: DUF2723 domain-containing protein [Cytophagales bacterium]|nr:DUF2723 domain-containing protein [Cytophagales bacterium]